MQKNIWLLGFMISAIVLLITSGVWAQPAIGTSKHKIYQKKYAALQGLSLDAMVLNLDDSLEDLLITGSHAVSTSSNYKVRRLKRRLFSRLKIRLCSPKPEVIQSAAEGSLKDLMRAEHLEMSNAQYGKIEAILVRIIQKATLEQFCRSESFDQLGK